MHILDSIRKHIVLNAALERVWRAISDSAEFGAWFGMKIEGAFEPGVRLRASISPTKVDPAIAAAQKPHEGKAFELFVEEVSPQTRLSFRWHPHAIEDGRDYASEPTTLVTFELEQLGPRSTGLTVTESGFDSIPLDRRAKAFDANSHGWGMIVTLVEKYVAIHSAK